jgi:phosphatidylglycerol:prolipoprotein diacylglycerol transferase
MHPHLLDVPVFLLALLGGAVAAASVAAELLGKARRALWLLLAAVAGGAVSGWLAQMRFGWENSIPVQSYGTMILVGFLFGVWMAARRAPQLGIAPRHCIDLGLWGVVVGLAGARALHIAMYWPAFTPFYDGFDISRVGKWFRIWESGLAFHGAVIALLPFTWLYCRHYKLPPLAFLDLCLPSLIAGQAFGRIGCFLFGCCYGKVTDLPWAVCFPVGAPAFLEQVHDGLIPRDAICSLGVHPTQLYAAFGSGLIAAVLYAYWPLRRYDGQIMSLMLIMTGITRFFEELLRADERAAFAAAPWLTTSHWLALAAIVAGSGLLLCFKRRGKMYKAELLEEPGEAAHASS